ncbi:MAG: hypothetical protein GX883_01970 [Firmicutes bacterium]|nr:hypothetical protein [Bacillota bacterium]
MKKGYLDDERIILQKRKIGSDAFGIIYLGLLISVLVQQFLLKAPFSQYAAELVIFLAGAVYILVRNILVGNSVFREGGGGQKMVVLNSLVTGTTVAIIATVLNTVNYGVEGMGGAPNIALVALITFACGAILAFIGFEALFLINRKRQQQIEERYGDE